MVLQVDDLVKASCMDAREFMRLLCNPAYNCNPSNNSEGAEVTLKPGVFKVAVLINLTKSLIGYPQMHAGHC